MSRVVRGLLQLGNSKLGSAIHVWSLPAVQTCPGRTPTCERLCYATKSRFTLSVVRDRLQWNLAQAFRDDFVSRMAREITRKGVIVLRVHVSGDFMSAEYAKKWLDIFRLCPKVRFYAYTRFVPSPRHRGRAGHYGGVEKRPYLVQRRCRHRCSCVRPAKRSACLLAGVRDGLAGASRPGVPPAQASYRTPAQANVSARNPARARC